MAPLLCVLLVSGATHSSGDAAARFDAAISLVESTRFEDAIPKLRVLIYPPSLPAAKLKRARLALAQALFHTQQFDAARLELGYLFKTAPGYRIDSRDMAPDFVAFFESVRDSSGGKKRVAAAKPAEPETEKPTQVVIVQPAPAPASTPAPQPIAAVGPRTVATTTVAVDTWHPAPWYLAIIPFGGGQFAQHDIVAGSIFLVLEAALLGTNIAFAVINSKRVLSDGGFQLGSQSEIYYYTQQVSAGALYGTLIIGLLDGLLWSPKRMAAVHVTAGPVGASGAGAGVSGAF